MNRLLNISAAAALCAILTGCSQTGDETSTPTPSQTLTGQLIDAAVTGCRYQSASRSGTTNEKGEFNYLEGEEVEFFIGDFSLGRVKAARVITPLGLIKGTEPTDKRGAIASLDAQEQRQVTNLLRLLQSVDADGNSSNGIDLSRFSAKTFPTLTPRQLDDESALQEVMQTLAPDTPITSIEDALAHFTSEIDALHQILEKEQNPDANTVTLKPGTWYAEVQKQLGGNEIEPIDYFSLERNSVPLTKEALQASGIVAEYFSTAVSVTLRSVRDDQLIYDINGTINGEAVHITIIYFVNEDEYDEPVPDTDESDASDEADLLSCPNLTDGIFTRNISLTINGNESLQTRYSNLYYDESVPKSAEALSTQFSAAQLADYNNDTTTLVTLPDSYEAAITECNATHVKGTIQYTITISTVTYNYNWSIDYAYHGALIEQPAYYTLESNGSVNNIPNAAFDTSGINVNNNDIPLDETALIAVEQTLFPSAEQSPDVTLIQSDILGLMMWEYRYYIFINGIRYDYKEYLTYRLNLPL